MNYSHDDDQSLSGQSAASGSASEVSSQDIAPGPPNAKTLRLSDNRDDDDDDSGSDDNGNDADNDNGISSDDDSGDDDVNVSMDSMAGSMAGEDESDDGDENDDDNDEGDGDGVVHVEARAPQFRGKVLRMPLANTDDSDDDSIIAEAEAVTVAVADNDGDGDISMDADASIAEEASIETPIKDDDDDDDDSDSSGDELLISHKSRKKKKKEKKVKVRKKPGPKPKKKPGPKPKGPRKKPGPKPGKGKKGRKKEEVLAVAVVDDSVAAAVVVDGDKSDESVEGEVVAVAVAMDDDAPKKVRKKPGPKKGWKKRLAAESSAKGVISIVEVAKKKNMKKKKDGNGNGNDNGNVNANVNSNSNSNVHFSNNSNGFESDVDATATSTTSVARDRLEAAQAARDVLITSVQNTPFKFSDSHSVRNFGRIKIEDDSKDPLFSNSTALYPVGYSCDRYEFSPVHGRIVKMRCDILDGSKFQDVKKEDMDDNIAHNDVDAGNGKTCCGRGPVFRITWGMGIDELDDGSPFPFDLYSAAAPIGNEVDTVAVPLGLDSMNVEPKPAMRVKVRFEGDIWYHGTISDVNMKKEESEPEKKKRGAKKKGKKVFFNVTINYDDGMTEEVTYPDSDVVLVAPGSESIGGGILNVTDVKGSPVTSVHGKTPLEAWANALIKIGLIDEVMYEKALESISTARIEGVNEVKGRMEALRKQRQEARARQLQKQRDQLGLSPTSTEKDTIDDDQSGLISEDGKEPPSEKEIELKKRVQILLESYKERLAGSRKVAIALADARIEAQDRFLCNPFFDDDASQTHQKNWIAAVIKKEKSKMGSTGNKRKIVTPTDILDRNATFYNTDIERLIEGLPGAEYCGDYIFHDLRGNAGASQNSWMHEAKVRKEKEKVQKRKRARENEEKASLEQERERKRKARDDERENRKKQKLEELDQQKQSRKEERLSRLKTQIEDRLFKESCFQRERVVLLASKLCGKEMTRRKKVSEIIAGNVVEFSTSSEENNSFPTYNLPRLSQDFDADIVRLHDFLTTYKSYFCGHDMLTSIPSLDELQRSVNTFSSPKARTRETMEAFNLLNDVGVVLCKPLTTTLIKTLSSALTTGLQGKSDEEDPGDEEDFQDDPDDFHVTRFSWKEVFRLVLLSDVLSEIGLTKIEQTHVLRGYRSGGHPNSKEAKRIRRGEDSALVLRRQGMVFNSNEISQSHGKGSRFIITVPAPCTPSVGPSHWLYYLHNIKALPSNAATGMKSNLRKACSMLKTSATAAELDKESMISNLEGNINLLDQIGTTFTSSSETIQVCKKVRRSILKALDTATSEIFSLDKSTDYIYRNDCIDSIGKFESFSEVNFTAKNSRLRSGLLDDLSMSDVEYKKIMQEKEEYLAEAIKFKEEEERKQKVAAGEVEDDDDDDDEEDEEDEVTEEKKDTPEDGVNTKIAGLSPTKEEENLGRIGKKTEFDEFCADVPGAPELLRRCLAVLRNLCMSSPADTFLYPVDPQANLKYYESVLRPMSLYDVGKFLQNTIQEYQGKWEEVCVESIVAKFARKIRIIGKNPICFSPVGGPLISTAEEMLRIFERLFFDWILVPKSIRPALETLDDEKCVEFHISDEESMVLLCDGCEGKYNMSRLNPPLRSVPKGDWYCNRCRSGYCWASVDPRIGKHVMKSSDVESSKALKGRITECRVCLPGKESKNTMHYVVRFENGIEELWSLGDIDTELKKRGHSIDRIECLEAVTESPGYGCGVESRLPLETVPALLNPKVSDVAAQKFMASSSFRNTVLSCAILLTSDIDGISATEWLQIFNLLVLKCMASDTIQEVASKLESETFSKLNEMKSAEVSKIKSIQDILPKLSNNENDKQPPAVPTDIPAVVGSGVQGEESESIVELKRQRAATVKTVKGRRRKREDTFMASAIKKQLKPAISSLEEDNVSRVINNALSSNDDEITFASNRCRSVNCDFCGLSDVTLGSPLFRVPNDEEWEERKDFLIKGRNSLLIAEFGIRSPCAMLTENLRPIDNGQKSTDRKFVTVSIKICGEVIADDEHFETKDGGVDIMSCGLLPRNKSGFQQELKARADDLLHVPLITGSMSAHECCALAAHKARKEKMLQTAKKKISHQMELAHGNKCGRTMSIGYDKEGRSYWHFESNPGSLFIFVKQNCGASQGKFLRFNSSEIIASVIMSLGRQEISKDLKAFFPKAQELLENGTWSGLLQKRAFQKLSHHTDTTRDSDILIKKESAEPGLIYDPGDEILVESSTRKILWDAKVIAAAKKDKDGPIIGYRVKYKDWSSRFDEWVAPWRVFDTNDENLMRQHNCATMLAKEPTVLPQAIKNLVASSFLDSPNRARDLSYMPNFAKFLRTPNNISLEDEVFTEMKVAVLLIEAALPAGSVKKTGKGIWKPETASYWRSMVNKATTPGDLMGCLVLLETAISKDWLRPNAAHLISCLPRSWKSINEASISSISLRLWTLDQGIKYALSRGDDGNWETVEAEEESSDEEE